MTTKEQVLARARDFALSGLSVVPVKADGSKAPAVLGWKKYQTAAADAEQLGRWFGDGKRTGLGLVTGYGDLECLEFESSDVWGDYQKAAASVGLSSLLDRVAGGYSERSPGGGVHLLYRCEAVSGNTPLARAPALGSKPVLIETRGVGGFVIVAPSYGKVHESGKPYVLLAGGPETVERITGAERQELFNLARSFDRQPVKPPREAARNQVHSARPGDNYNRRDPAWSTLLEPHGWVAVYEHGGTTYWRRPGKAVGISATTNHAGSDLLWMFSTSAAPFEAERSYDKFGAYAVLEHDRDFAKAAMVLADDGYDVDNGRFLLVSPADLAGPVTPMLWGIRGVWPMASHGPLAGAKKSFKSYNVLALGIAWGSGLPYLGKFEVENPGPVLLYSGEGGQGPFQRRFQRLCAAYGIDPAQQEVPLWPTFDIGPLDSPEFLAALRRNVEEVQPSLIIIDPLYTYHPAKIEAQNLYERGRMLGDLSAAVTHNTALIVVDHYRKTGAAHLDLDEIGQSGVAQWADSWILQGHREGSPDLDAGTARLAVEHGSRQWGGRRWDIDWELGRFDEETGTHDGEISWIVEPADPGSAGRGTGARKLSHEDLLRLVHAYVRDNCDDPDRPTTRRRVVDAVVAANPVGDRRVRAAFDELVEDRLLVAEKRSVPEGARFVERDVYLPGNAVVRIPARPESPGEEQ